MEKQEETKKQVSNTACKTLLSDISAIFMDPTYADVIFILEEERIPAHRAILAARCEYFRAMLYGDCEEKQQSEIRLPWKLTPFKIMLKYLYTNKFDITPESINGTDGREFICEFHNLVKIFGFKQCLPSFCDILLKCLNKENVINTLKAANRLDWPELRDGIRLVQLQLLNDILASCEKNPDENFDVKLTEKLISLALFYIQLLCIKIALEQVAIHLIDKENIPTKFQEYKMDTLACGRGINLPDVNVADIYESKDFSIEEVREFDPRVEYWQRGGVLLKLTNVFIINWLGFCLKRDGGCYYVEVSTDEEKWQRIIDFTKYECFEAQSLYFERRPVRFIRIVGVDYRPIDFEAMNRTKVPRMINGFIAPRMKIFVNGDTMDSVETDDNDHIVDYVSTHWIVILNQPYYISSIRATLFPESPDAVECSSRLRFETNTEEYKQWAGPGPLCHFLLKPNIDILSINGPPEKICIHFE